MSITTSQQIYRYYDLYKTVDVTFTKDVIRATGLNSKQVFLKCVGEQWPCVIYSSSMSGAKIIASTKSDLFEKVRNANNLVSLRFSFRIADKADPLSFFVAARVAGYTPYNQDKADLSFLNLVYTQRPPDDLIEILGKLLEASVNSKKRREERIVITADSIRKLGLKSKDLVVSVEGVPRKCIVRDLSFSGAKVLVLGVARFLLHKDAELRLELDDRKEPLLLRGRFIRHEPVEGRKDIAALAISFHEESIPMEYKMRINDYLGHIRKAPSDHQESS